MALPTSYRDAHIAGIRAARVAARELNLEDAPWIDAFDAVIRAGAFLVFQPLRTLFGVFLPKFETGDAPGVMINVKHPLNLQRYTAAHELGHLWMGHESSLDTEAEILGLRARSNVRTSPVEVAAEVFAAHLLMPLHRVLPRMRAQGYQQQDLRNPEAAYALSLWFGVSYRAMVRHLTNLKQVSPGLAEQLLKTPPKAIKQGVIEGGELASWRADVWPLTERESGELLHVKVGDELSITLPSHAAGGYLWDSSSVDDQAFEIVAFDDVGHGSGEVDRRVVGAAPMRRARIRVKSDGSHGLSLAERRPWQGSGSIAHEFHLTIVGMSQPQIGAAEQLRRRHIST
jgi:Zn-dependent peptidase ImmA (M78 family)/predicted secreted protein